MPCHRPRAICLPGRHAPPGDPRISRRGRFQGPPSQQHATAHLPNPDILSPNTQSTWLVAQIKQRSPSDCHKSPWFQKPEIPSGGARSLLQPRSIQPRGFSSHHLLPWASRQRLIEPTARRLRTRLAGSRGRTLGQNPGAKRFGHSAMLLFFAFVLPYLEGKRAENGLTLPILLPRKRKNGEVWEGGTGGNSPKQTACIASFVQEGPPGLGGWWVHNGPC